MKASQARKRLRMASRPQARRSTARFLDHSGHRGHRRERLRRSDHQRQHESPWGRMRLAEGFVPWHGFRIRLAMVLRPHDAVAAACPLSGADNTTRLIPCAPSHKCIHPFRCCNAHGRTVEGSPVVEPSPAGRRMQNVIYRAGLYGRRPKVPVNIETLHNAAAKTMSPQAHGYIDGSAGNETTNENNRRVFDQWHLVPRMAAGH